MTRLGWFAALAVLICSTHIAAQAPVAAPAPPPPTPVLIGEPQAAPVPPPPPPVGVPPQAPPPTWGAAPVQQTRDASLTISPIHLFAPVLELTLEARLADQLGLALIGGIGQLTTTASDGTSNSFTAYELGTSFRYYAVGNFDGGMQLGAELLWVHVALDSSTSGSDVSGVAAGVAVGPMIGYKYTADVGFTFDGQLGFQWVAMQAKASSAGDTATAEQKSIIPLLNLNIGWSF